MSNSIDQKAARAAQGMRSSSAPPTALQHEGDDPSGAQTLSADQISPNDPRTTPQYYQYYYSQRPLDPRLPPPLVSWPGTTAGHWTFTPDLSQGPYGAAAFRPTSNDSPSELGKGTQGSISVEVGSVPETDKKIGGVGQTKEDASASPSPKEPSSTSPAAAATAAAAAAAAAQQMYFADPTLAGLTAIQHQVQHLQMSKGSSTNSSSQNQQQAATATGQFPVPYPGVLPPYYPLSGLPPSVPGFGPAPGQFPGQMVPPMGGMAPMYNPPPQMQHPHGRDRQSHHQHQQQQHGGGWDGRRSTDGGDRRSSQEAGSRGAGGPRRSSDRGSDRRPSRNHETEAERDPNAPPRSALLEEFRSTKNRKFELRDITGFMAEFSCDQHGSRFIQHKLETADEMTKQDVFEEILPDALKLMTDVFGNYVIQKYFDHGAPEQRSILADQLVGHMLPLAMQMYGCRVIQKALEAIDEGQQELLVRELDGHVMKCVKDQNGNHVIQKCIEKISSEKIQFIVDEFVGHAFPLATHPYGCRVVQRVLEHCNEAQVKPILDELLTRTQELVVDQYGNYVIQHVLERGPADRRTLVVQGIKHSILSFTHHKFASNVVEKCLIHGSASDRRELIGEMVKINDAGGSIIDEMVKDQFGNYVVQRSLDVAEPDQRQQLVDIIKERVAMLRKYTYGKHILNRIEKLSGPNTSG